MTRMTEQDRTRYATRPDDIPRDVQCDRCERQAVARGTDGHQAFAYCAADYMKVWAELKASRPTRDQLIAGDIVRYRHVPTGEIRAALFLRHVPEYNALIAMKADGGQVAVHRDNVVGQ